MGKKHGFLMFPVDNFPHIGISLKKHIIFCLNPGMVVVKFRPLRSTKHLGWDWELEELNHHPDPKKNIQGLYGTIHAV
jgi:hypothetical protein